MDAVSALDAKITGVPKLAYWQKMFERYGSVDPQSRQIGIGTHLFKAISKEIRASGVKVVRTMLARDDNLNMSFFRSHGMTGGSFIQLEMPLDRNGAEREEAT